MRYSNITEGIFLDRPNRFVAHVRIGGRKETVHVKNTGRCRELLLPGAAVYCTAPGTPNRKTEYDLVAVRKSNGLLINMDSQAPNRVAKEWLLTRGYDEVLSEYAFGQSRIDFCLRRGGRTCLMEVKGCTLEVNGTGYFPDAPTLRGVKHLRELTSACRQGYDAVLAYVIQMDGVTRVRPNLRTDPAYGEALLEAKAAGVRVLFLACHAEPNSLTATGFMYEDECTDRKGAES